MHGGGSHPPGAGPGMEDDDDDLINPGSPSNMDDSDDEDLGFSLNSPPQVSLCFFNYQLF